MSTTETELVQEQIEVLLREFPADVTPPAEFWGAQFDLGLAWVQFPQGFGGLGVNPQWQMSVNEAIVAAGGSVRNRLKNLPGIGIGAHAVMTHGTAEMKRTLLRPMFTTEEIWCQLFSEPGAGSDLASVATSAVPDGDEWIINGQKVWNTLGHVARWGLLLTRSDPRVPKHQGLSYFVMDMHAEGVEVRPLWQITGEAEFNEVYFTDARVPDSMRLGEIGAGWKVAVTTLMNERVAIGRQLGARGTGSISHAISAWRESGSHGGSSLEKLVLLWTKAEALRLTIIRANESANHGNPGPEGSTAKVEWARLNKEITAFAVDLLGVEGTLYPAGYAFERVDEIDFSTTDLRKAYLRARPNSVEGGSSEIMKNILGERILGLPGEPRVDKDVAWIDVARN